MIQARLRDNRAIKICRVLYLAPWDGHGVSFNLYGSVPTDQSQANQLTLCLNPCYPHFTAGLLHINCRIEYKSKYSTPHINPDSKFKQLYLHLNDYFHQCKQFHNFSREK